MKLKTYNPDTCPSHRMVKDKSISLNLKRGVITINVSLARAMNLELGDSIMLHQDEDRPTDWYITKSRAKEQGFSLRNLSSKSGVLGLANRLLVDSILRSCNRLDIVHCKLRVGEPIDFDGRQMYPIITGPIIEK